MCKKEFTSDEYIESLENLLDDMLLTFKVYSKLFPVNEDFTALLEIYKNKFKALSKWHNISI